MRSTEHMFALASFHRHRSLAELDFTWSRYASTDLGVLVRLLHGLLLSSALSLVSSVSVFLLSAFVFVLGAPPLLALPRQAMRPLGTPRLDDAAPPPRAGISRCL